MLKQASRPLPQRCCVARCSLGERDMRNGMLRAWHTSQAWTTGELQSAGALFGPVGRFRGGVGVRCTESKNVRRHMCVGKMMQFHINMYKSHSMPCALKSKLQYIWVKSYWALYVYGQTVKRTLLKLLFSGKQR